MRSLIGGLLFLLLIVSSGAQAQVNECFFAGSLDTLALHHAPLTHATQLKAELPGGVAYSVQRQHGEHYLIAIDHAYGGWVDRRSGRLSGDCASIPVDTTPLSDFPTVCLYSAAVAVPAFLDEQMTMPFGNIPAQQSLPVVEQTAAAHYLLLDHATGAWVSAGSGSLSGGCVTRNVYALANARLWSQPDVKNGQLLATLQPGSSVNIIGNPVPGPIRFDTADTGLWYPVKQGTLSGWIWAERLTDYPQPADGPTALANARVWSQPDVRSGQLLTTLPVGQNVTILGGPVLGAIRFDTPTQGNWYQVQANNITGWVWSERLSLP